MGERWIAVGTGKEHQTNPECHNSGCQYMALFHEARENEKKLAQAEARARRLEEALRKIADGRWNVGATEEHDCRGFARSALASSDAENRSSVAEEK